jgi:hypothetical protein
MGDESAIESDPEDPPVLKLGEAAQVSDHVAGDEFEYEDEFEYDDELISIEPVIASSDPIPATPSGDAAGGLGDIGEEDEEAAEADGDTSVQEPKEEVVQGLRICTSPQPPLSSYALGHSPSQPFAFLAEPSPSVLHLDAHAPQAGGLSPGVTGASPNAPGVSPGATGASAASFAAVQPSGGSAQARVRSFSSSSYGSARSANRGYYDVLGERGPGHPLFPSSFAQLALAPTLSAK